MKKLFVTAIIIGVSITATWAQKKPNPCTKRSWVLSLTPQTKKEYIDSVVAVWKTDSINLKFTVLYYNSKGLLEKMKGSVDVGGSPSGTFGSDKLVSYEIKIEDRPNLSIKGK